MHSPSSGVFCNRHLGLVGCNIADMRFLLLLLITLLLSSCTKESEEIINRATVSADSIIAGAQTLADSILYIARKESEKITNQSKMIETTNKKKLEEVFGRLRKYQDGVNVVNRKYIVDFRIDGNTIITTMKNSNTTGSIKPDAKILFINEYGFITYTVTIYWLISVIGPGETRVDTQTFSPRYGNTVYYHLEFD